MFSKIATALGVLRGGECLSTLLPTLSLLGRYDQVKVIYGSRSVSGKRVNQALERIATVVRSEATPD